MMRVKFFLATFILALTSAQVFAANGCAPGTFSITPSPDGRAASVLFDKFEVVGGGGIPGETRNCILHVPMTVAAGSVAVYKVDYRGFAHLAGGQTSILRVAHLAGTDVYRTKGPFDDDTIFSGLIGGGLSGVVDSRLTLKLLSAPSLDDALATLDSVDLAEFGTTTIASVNASLDQLATERVALLTHLSGIADLLLGFGQPLDGPSGAAAVAAFGSTTLGADARWNIGDGISLLGGAAYIEESAGGASIGGSALLAGGVRATLPAMGAFQPFVEGGVWGAPDLAMHFTRSYANGFGVGDASGALVTAYARGGVVVSPDTHNEIALSATLARNWLTVDGYGELGGPANLFAATVNGDTSSTDLVKVAAAWTAHVTSRIDFTVSGAVGRTFGSSPVTADVEWIGPVTGHAGDLTFFEYGARAGFSITPAASVHAFVLGTTGDKIGTHTQFGGAFKVKF